MKRVLIVASLVATSVAAYAQDVPLEYQVKAAYLFNFTKFVEWPAATVNQDPFTICVADRNPFGTALAATIQGEVAAGRMLASRVVQNPGASCHVLFVPRGVPAAPYLMRVREAPVLTVGETPEFLAQGGIIRFVMEDGKIRFEINQEAARRASLRISARLLQLARAVE